MIYRTSLLCLLGVLSLPIMSFAEYSLLECVRRKHHSSYSSHSEGEQGLPGPMGFPGSLGSMGAQGAPFSRPVAYGDFYLLNPASRQLNLLSMAPILVGATARTVNGISTANLASAGVLIIQTTGTYDVSYLVDVTATTADPLTFSTALTVDGQVVPLSLRSILLQTLPITEVSWIIPTTQIQGQIQLELVAGQSLSLINASPYNMNIGFDDDGNTPVIASLTIQRIK